MPWNGQIASPPCRSRTACSRSAISPSASSQEIRSKRPSPLAPVRRSGCSEPVGRARVVEVARDLGAQRAARERVVRVAAQPDRLAVAHGHQPRAAVGAVERAGAVDLGLHRPPTLPPPADPGRAAAIGFLPTLVIRPSGGVHASDPSPRGHGRDHRLCGCAGRRRAQAEAGPTPPPGAIGNVDFVANLPEMKWATAINFLQYGRHARDARRPAGSGCARTTSPGPTSRGSSTPSTTRRCGCRATRRSTPDDSDDEISTYWQNEDMDVDRERKLVFMARDPRSFEGTTRSDTSVAGVYIVDAAQPARARADHVPPAAHRPHHHVHQRLRLPVDRRAGELGRASSRHGRADGRSSSPTCATRRTRGRCAQPIDLFRNDGVTAYSHDVQVDGDGHRLGLGRRRRARLLDRRAALRPARAASGAGASAIDPIPYAGGEFDDEEAAPTEFMHNAFRPAGSSAATGPTGARL